MKKYPKLSYRNSCHFCGRKGKCKHINFNIIRPYKYMLKKNGDCKKFQKTIILDCDITMKKHVNLLVEHFLDKYIRKN
jgi:hypothetical protein